MSPPVPTRSALRFRDAAAAAAFASVAISRELPLWVCLLFALGTAFALAGRRPLEGAPQASLLLVLAAGGALYIPVFVGEGDLVVTACAFAGLLLLQRLLCSPDAGTNGQIHLISLLLVAGGAALSGELLFALCLALYGTLAILALGHGLLGSVSKVERSAATRRLLTCALFAALGAAALFVLFPRLSWNVAAQKLPKAWSRSETGLSDRIRLQAGGTLKTNPRVVFRSRLTPDPKVSQLELYWVAHLFTQFNGRDWFGEPSAQPPTWELEWTPGNDRDLDRETRQETEVSAAMGSKTLPLLETPVWVGAAYAADSRGERRIPLSEYREGSSDMREARVTRLPTMNGFRFEARSRTSGDASNIKELEQKEAVRSRQLPPQLDPRVAALARKIAGNTRDPLAAAERLAGYLKRELRYTLETPDSPSDDPLSDFLFSTRAGHCEHFATALTVMLRTLGFEARVATGFYGGSRSETGQYLVRAGDAHAWTQVFSPEHGFVTVDATPESFRSASPPAWKDWLTERYEQLMDLWRNRVLDYSFRDQAQWATRWTRSSASAESPGAQPSPSHPGRRVALGLVLLVAVSALVWMGRLFRARRLSSLHRHPASAAWQEIERRIVRQGGATLRRTEDETPSEWIDRLSGNAPQLAHPLRAIQRRYEEARFGRRPLKPGEARGWLKALR